MGANRPATIEEALSYCLDNPEGLSTEALLSSFPEFREELEPLLALDTEIMVAAGQELPEVRRLAMQARLVNIAAAGKVAVPVSDGRVDAPAADGRPKTTDDSVGAKHPSPVGGRPPSVVRRPAFLRWAGAAAAALAIGLLWWLSAASLPDSLFYGVKLTTEDLFLNSRGSRVSALREHAKLAIVRLGDITTMQTLDRLGLAGPAFDNYDYHMGNCLRLWELEDAPRDPEVASLLYASSVAGDQVFAGVAPSASDLPERFQENLKRTADVLESLNASTGEYLQQAGLDLEEVLRTSDAGISRFLTPVPGVPTATAVVAPTPSAPPVATLPTVEPTLTAALWIAQTAIAEGGDASTPVIAAAETVIAGGTGTPVAQAVQTLLAYTTATPGETAAATPIQAATSIPTAALPALTATVVAVPSITPGVPATLPANPPVDLTAPAVSAPMTVALPSPTVLPPVSPAVVLPATVPQPPPLPQDPGVPAPGIPAPTLPIP